NLHRLCPSGDTDFIAIGMSAAYTYTLEADAVGTQVDTVLRLYDPNHNLLVENDPPSSRNSSIVIHPTTNGYYLARVLDHANAGSSGNGFLYNFSIIRQGNGAPHIFEDVPPGSTFFEYVEGLASQGVMSGYPCGGLGEPCLPPDNRPYFRPSNNATRGQTSK